MEEVYWFKNDDPATHVDLLLKHGADPKARTNHGMTALQLARSPDWKNVIAVLARHSQNVESQRQVLQRTILTEA